MRETVIIRRKVRSDFTTLPNGLIRDGSLSWKALGLLVYVLSLPPDFRLRLSHLAQEKKCGRDATRSGLKELELAGYLHIRWDRTEDGKFRQIIWEVTDTPTRPGGCAPEALADPLSENPKTAMPKPGKPNSGNPTLLSTNTEQVLSKKNTTTQSRRYGPSEPASNSDRLQPTEVCFPDNFQPNDLDALKSMLEGVPTADAQMLVNELMVTISVPGKIRTTPVKWFAGVVRRYHRGSFNSTAHGIISSESKGVDISVKSDGPKTASRTHEVAKKNLSEIAALFRVTQP